MHSHTVYKSSSLRGPKFDDEMNGERISTTTPVKTWKIVPSNTVKKLSFQDTISKAMKSFTIKTSNRFDGIKEDSCHSSHIEPSDVNVIQKPLQKKLKEKKRIKIKKVKKIKKNKVKESKKCYIPDSNRAPSFDKTSKQEVTRCNKCFITHFPLPKFCRWTEEHAVRNRRQNKKDDFTTSREINPVSKYIEMIKTRINLIQEKCTSSNYNTNPED